MGPSRIAGRYELEKQLGEGGMGVVWRALDTKTGSPVAIKLMKDISDPVAVELFTKEWRALAEMCHPNIVDVRDVDVIDENRQKKPFFVMPLLQGATLSELIEKASARLTIARVVEITTQVCRGLQAAHQRGQVHRDLKPSNIFVMDDDTVKIIDFGVVHLAGSKSVTGQKGTFQYMSPEQAQLKEITPSSDLFSMGVILYEALTRRKPFARNTASETMEAVINYMPPPVSEINPSVNQSLSMVVHKCLAKRPIHRFSSARELAETLQKAFRNEPVFDPAKIEPRIARAKAAFNAGDETFASEIMAELEAEGHLDPRITVLRMRIDVAVKQKKIRQLLEGARARVEQDEIPLALDKLREVLELDPQNPDALAMREMVEKQRSDAQISKWFELAQTHLENRDFGAARHAAQELLAIRAGDTRALDLLEQIESTEAEARRVREQKEQLYNSALRAYQNGEIETALNKLERLFSVAVANPCAAVPERDAVYQSFYKEVRSERDTIHSALEEAQRHFGEKNFAEAMAVCRELLSKYPDDGTFQALKIRIEDAERQERSAYVAEVSKAVDSEPDLDRRVDILRQASERYPNEVSFAQQLKLVRERRDLVNSVVAKARQYEEKGQYSEAITQWDILRNIHPQYPGMAFEVEQCKKKRDRLAREEEQARVVEVIDRLMQGRLYGKAIECADAALVEFPGDAELAGLRTLAEQALERSKESRRLFEEGQHALAAKDMVRATDLLRTSLSLDPRAPGLRDALVSVLAERARLLAEDNWQDAEPLYEEVHELDSNHPAVRLLRSTISEAKRQTFVGQRLAECRSLVAAGKVHEAARRLREARAEYPNDVRLEQYEASLQKELNETRLREERGRDRTALEENRRVLEQNPERARVRAVLEGSYAIRAKHPDDAEIGRSVAEIELAVKRVAQVDDLSQILRLETALVGTDGQAVAAKPALVEAGPEKGPRLVEIDTEKTKIFQTQDRKRKESSVGTFAGKAKIFLHNFPQKAIALVWPTNKRLWARLVALSAILSVARVFLHDIGQKAVALVWPTNKRPWTRLAALIAIFMVGGATAYFVKHRPSSFRSTKPQTRAISYISITTDPADSTIINDGQPVTSGMAAAGSIIEVTHLGYKKEQIQLRSGSDGKITLKAEPLQIAIQTSVKDGAVELDGSTMSDQSSASLGQYSLAPDGNSHKLSFVDKGKRLFTIEFKTTPGSRPQVTAWDANDLFVVATLGTGATIYPGNLLKTVRLGDQDVPISPSGTDFTLSEQSKEIEFGDGNDLGSLALEISNAPGLVVHSLTSPGQLVISTNAEPAILTLDGTPVRRQRGRWLISGLTGVHQFVLTAEGYEPRSWTMTLQRGRTSSKYVELALQAKPVTLASLLISGGTAGANVDLDGKRMGVLDDNGSIELRNLIPGGKHVLTISKANHESRVFEIPPSGPSSEIRVPNAALIPWATLTLQPTVDNATVKFRRVGESQFHDAPSGKIPLPPGAYEIVAEAPGFEKFLTSVNLASENVGVTLKLVPIADYEFEDASQVLHEGQWIKAKNAGKFINLKPGLLQENLVFAHPGKTLFWSKKVEWLIESSEGKTRVQYSLEGQKLTRKLVVGKDTSSVAERKADARAQGQQVAISLHVRVDGDHIVVTNDKRVVLDDFAAQDQDFTNGRIAIRTDSLFLIRRD